MTEENCIHELLPGTCLLCRPPRRKWAPPRRPTESPRSADDPIVPLHGTKDISLGMYAIDPYLGERTDWLVGHGYPHDLRPRGWVYLRYEDRLAARVRAVGMGWREDRPVRTGEDPGGKGFGPGLVFEVDPETWQRFDQPLGEDAGWMHQGYRYHLTDRSGVVHHLMAGDPIPDGDWDLDG